MMKRLVLVLVLAAVATSLSACGRKGRPIPPEDAVYPRQYPKIDFPGQQQQRPPETQEQQ
jgi:predicted small lipoprotein YifL